MKMNSNLATIPARPRANRTIGAILIDAGLLTVENAEQVLHMQRQNNLRFGEAAIRLGLLTEADIQYALARQFDYAYLRLSDRKTVSEAVVAAYKPFGAQADQVRAIRSQLMLRWFDRQEQRQTLAIVGPSRGEGRSYLAANLAVAFAQLGERTLLIDADMRHPLQHDLFKLDNKIGLSTLLAQRSREEAIVRITDLVGLSVLPAGPVPPNPSELIYRSEFEALLTHARTSYDVVLIDTPALSDGDEAAVIALRAGAALAVARTEQTRIARFAEMVQGLSDAGVLLVGSVLNDVPLKSKKAGT
jgi:protein-tyrosine kinase